MLLRIDVALQLRVFFFPQATSTCVAALNAHHSMVPLFSKIEFQNRWLLVVTEFQLVIYVAQASCHPLRTPELHVGGTATQTTTHNKTKERRRC